MYDNPNPSNSLSWARDTFLGLVWSTPRESRFGNVPHFRARTHDIGEEVRKRLERVQAISAQWPFEKSSRGLVF